MKEDAPTPTRIPVKRKEITAALPHWLREWLADPDATTYQKQMLTAEINRRKSLRTQVRVGIVFGAEGLTPDQKNTLEELLETAPPDAIVISDFAAVRIKPVLSRYASLPRIVTDDYKDLVQDSTIVYTFAKPGAQTGVGWEAMRYAKHRKVPVRLIMQNGEESPLSRG